MFATIAIFPIANTVAVTIADAIRAWLDRRIPDDLPLTAGAWIEREIARLGYISLRVIVTERSRNWFAPDRRVIHLAATTYCKRDPLYWGVAAHELGHARFAFLHPVLASLFNAILVMRSVLAMVGVGLAFGNVMVAVPMIGHVAFACLVVAVALHLVVLVEEAYASIFAYGLVRRSGVVPPRRMIAVAIVLMLAWNTYLTSVAAYVAMLSRWALVTRAIGGGWIPSAGVTALGYGVAGAATLALVVAVATRVAGHRRFALTRVIAHVAILWIMWDSGHPWATPLAVVPFAAFLGLLASLPSFAIVTPLGWLLRNVTGVHASDELAAERSRIGDAIKRGNRVYDELTTRDRRRLSLRERLAELDALLVLPLVILFWLTS